MSALRSAAVGALSLITLEVVVSSNASAARVGTAATQLASVVQRVVSPTVAAIPDLRTTATGQAVAANVSANPAASTSTSSATSSATVSPATASTATVPVPNAPAATANQGWGYLPGQA